MTALGDDGTVPKILICLKQISVGKGLRSARAPLGPLGEPAAARTRRSRVEALTLLCVARRDANIEARPSASGARHRSYTRGSAGPSVLLCRQGCQGIGVGRVYNPIIRR